jgi:hypothetical protein
MSYGANGIEQVGNDAPTGQTVGQTASSLVGFHGNATTQGLTGTYLGTTGLAGASVILPLDPATVGYTGCACAINCVVQLLRDKGLERSI